jgi:hypothetical protein
MWVKCYGVILVWRQILKRLGDRLIHQPHLHVECRGISPNPSSRKTLILETLARSQSRLQSRGTLESGAFHGSQTRCSVANINSDGERLRRYQVSPRGRARGNRTFVLDVENRDLPTKVVAPKNHMCWVGSLAGRAFGEHNLFNR